MPICAAKLLTNTMTQHRASGSVTRNASCRCLATSLAMRYAEFGKLNSSKRGQGSSILYSTVWRTDFTRYYEKRLDPAQQTSVIADINQKLKPWDGTDGGPVKRRSGIWEIDILSRRFRILLCVHGNEIWLLDIISKQNERRQYAKIERHTREHREYH